jgi:hypothetical protein
MGVLETPERWAEALIDAFRNRFAPAQEGQEQTLLDLLLAIAASRESREVSRIYVAINDWAGPVYVADLIVLETAPDDGRTLESIAGIGDPEAVEEPMVEPFVTSSGLAGLESVRYVNPEDAGQLLARVDYVFPTPTGFVQLYTAQFDLVAFERVRPLMEELARSISISEAVHESAV